MKKVNKDASFKKKKTSTTNFKNQLVSNLHIYTGGADFT